MASQSTERGNDMTLDQIKEANLNLEEVKELIDDWFDDEVKREDLEDLAEYIESNLSDF